MDEERGLLGIYAGSDFLKHELPEHDFHGSKVCTPVPCQPFEGAELEIPCWSSFHADGVYRWHVKGCKGEQDCGKFEGCYTEPVLI